MYRVKRLPGSNVDVIKHVANRLGRRLQTTASSFLTQLVITKPLCQTS